MKTVYLTCQSQNCRKIFTNQESLDVHIKDEHPGRGEILLMKFQCSECKKVLRTKQSLKEHSYTHTGQKPYKCNEQGCTKVFRQSSQLSYHKKIHSEIKKQNQKSKLEKLAKQGKSTENEACGTNKETMQEDFLITTDQLSIKLPNIFS